MGGWPTLLGGMLVWAAHFFALYAFGSIWGSSATARIATLAATALALAADALILVRILRQTPPDEFSRWTRSLGLTGCALAALAILWQALPALIG